METIAALDGKLCQVEIVRAPSTAPTIQNWSWSETVATMLFRSADVTVQGAYSLYDQSYNDLGTIFLSVPRRGLTFRGGGGSLRAVHCRFKRPCFKDMNWGRTTGLELRRTFSIDRPQAHVLMRLLMQETLHPGVQAPAMIDALASALVLECGRSIRPEFQPLEMAREPGLRQQHLRLIDNRLRKPALPAPSVKELAQLCGYNTKYFEKLFKLTTGITAGKYICDWKFRFASDLLINTDLPLKEIAYRAGFSNAANFSRAFKTEMRIAPGAFRNIGRSRY